MCFLGFYGIIGIRLMQYGMASPIVTGALGNVALHPAR
jgi:cell division protein FtsI (penicillin-binding protein 3)